MLLSPEGLVFLSTLAIVLWGLKILNSNGTNGKKLPGPSGIPFFGNLFQIPPYHSWLKFKEWSDEFGPIVRFSMAGSENVILSTETDANNLLRERGTKYSSRAYLPFATGLLSDNLRPLLLPYNDRWRRGRKLMHQLTNTNAAESYQPIQDTESKRLLAHLLKEPSRYGHWFDLYASGVVFRVGFGQWIDTGEESVVKRIVQVNHNLERVAQPGTYLVDTFPILGYLPSVLAPFKREGQRLHEEELSLFRQLQSDVRKQIVQGNAPNSFTRTFLEHQEALRLSDDEGAYVVGTMFEAGSGTTSAAMQSFCLAMCHFPDWQQKMKEQLDQVVGNRMPEFSDIPNLPTVRAVIKEVLRWRPVTSGGVPHQLIQDDEYKGYHFSKGTVFHANQWAIHREPELYPDPENFRPERWLSPDFPTTFQEPLTKFPSLQNFSAFGFGRRICPGQNIAERSLNILTARIAWGLKLSKKEDSLGNDLPLPLYDYTRGFNSQPNHFDFDITPHSHQRAEQILEALKEAEASKSR